MLKEFLELIVVSKFLKLKLSTFYCIINVKYGLKRGFYGAF